MLTKLRHIVEKYICEKLLIVGFYFEVAIFLNFVYSKLGHIYNSIIVGTLFCRSGGITVHTYAYYILEHTYPDPYLARKKSSSHKCYTTFLQGF